MKTIIYSGILVLLSMIIQIRAGWTYELVKVLEGKKICCPYALANVDRDAAEEWMCIRYKEKFVGPSDTRMYVYKFNEANKEIELKWQSHDLASEGGDGFIGKIYSGDMDGDGIREIILIGWRIRADEEYRGTSYEGNIYVFEWDGKNFVQELKTTKYFFSHMTRPEEMAIADVFGTGKYAIITSQYEKLFLLEKEGNKFKERVLVTKERPAFIDFRVGDIDNDGKNEIIFGYGLPNEHVSKIIKYDSKEFEIIYRKTFVDKESKQIRIGDIREINDGMRLVTYTYDGKERYYKFIPKTEEYPGETEEERENKLKEIEVKNPIFKKKPMKYPGLSLPKGRHHFADIDGDGMEELINCGRKGVSVYKIK